ncbi:hypothetical protein RSK60_2020001 [Ralstonia solanacearum K60]|nr:hypothetical protein RSK60_2020001 [Ralstonia solanacearum K60]
MVKTCVNTFARLRPLMSGWLYLIESYSRIAANSCDPQSSWLDAVSNCTSQVASGKT